MSEHVGIIDYGMGNLFSVKRAFEYCGADVVISNDPECLLSSSRLVLPGVGAFLDGMRNLMTSRLDKVIYRFIESKKPFLGICLGMQMLGSVSEEFGEHEGLGIIPGRVCRISMCGSDGNAHKIPHVGWSQLKKPNSILNWENSILSGISEGEFVYSVHSYILKPDNEMHYLAYVDYDGLYLLAAVQKENIYGTQFHPEKSGGCGLKIINNFLKLK